MRVEWRWPRSQSVRPWAAEQPQPQSALDGCRQSPARIARYSYVRKRNKLIMDEGTRQDLKPIKENKSYCFNQEHMGTLAYASFMTAKSPMFLRNTVVFTTFCSDVPALASTLDRFLKTCSCKQREYKSQRTYSGDTHDNTHGLLLHTTLHKCIGGGIKTKLSAREDKTAGNTKGRVRSGASNMLISFKFEYFSTMAMIMVVPNGGRLGAHGARMRGCGGKHKALTARAM